MSKTRKLAILTVIAMALTLLPAQLFAAADASSLRLAGDNRQETAVQISFAGWDKAETLILAPANQANLVDALAAAPLAGQVGGPILLTPIDRLDSNVKARITTLGAKKVYVIGAISDAVRAEVDAMSNVTAVALKGSDRCETAGLVNALLTEPQGTFVVGNNALADALSVASYAAKNKFAIIVADSKGLIPEDQMALGKKTYLIGGPTLVANEISGTRIYGQDRFETNLEVAKALSYNYERIYVANGYQNHLVDSLAVAPLAAQYGSFIALADDVKYEIKSSSYVNTKVTEDARIIAVGGTSALSESLKSRVGTKQNEQPEQEQVSKAPKGVAPNKVEFTVNRLISNYNPDKITLSGNLITRDSAGNNMIHPKSAELVNSVVADECTVTLTLYGEVADTSFKSAASISLGAGAFTTILGIETGAHNDFITTFEDYSRPLDLKAGDARTQDEDVDGRIDGILITYSEDINTPSVTASDYTVEGYSVRDVSVRGNTVLVRVDEIAGDSDASPKITQVGEINDDSPRRNVLGPQALLTAVDGAAPVVSGVRNGLSYNEDVTPTFTEGSATLKKDGGAAAAFTSGTVINAEGSYVLSVSDAHNTTTVNFTIDKTKPNIISITFEADPTKITVAFSEAVVPSQAQNSANYQFTDFTNQGVDIASIDYDSAAYKAEITLNGEHGVNDILKVNPNVIHDLAGNVDNAGASETRV